MFRAGLWVSMLVVVATSADAQTTASGAVSGVVTDVQGAALQGVRLTATSPSVPGVRMATSDDGGRFRLDDLLPGDYEIVAELEGFARLRRSPVTVRAGLHLPLDLEMALGSVDEVVEVRQETPLLDSRQATQTVNISGDLLRAMPLSERREWFGALTLAPGVTTAEWTNNEKLIYVHGADSSANVVQIDGADMSPALMSSVRYIGLSTEAVDDIQVKTAGVDASAPLGIGGIINIATSSGTNRVKGSASLFVQPQSWNGSNTPGGTSSTVDQTMVDLSGGGPIVKDRLWAFGSYRFSDVNKGISRTADDIANLRALVPGYEPFHSTNRAHIWMAKLNGQLTSAHQLSGFVQRDVNPVSFGDAVAVNPRFESTGGMGGSARWSSVWSPRFTTRVGASFNDKRRDGRDPGIAAPLSRVNRSVFLSGGILIGDERLVDRDSPVSAWNEQPNSKLTISLDSTLVLGGGAHEVQMGLYAQPRTRLGGKQLFVNGGFAVEESVLRDPADLTAGTVPYYRYYADGTSLSTGPREGQDYAVYLQDSWRPMSRLTVNLGLRVDRIIWTDRQFDVRSQESTEIGPRFGLNYALTGDARTVLRVHWVRVHNQPTQMATSVGTSSLGFREEYDLDLDGTFETTFTTPGTSGLTPGRTFDPDLHQPFITEWGTGVSRQVGGGTAINVDFVRRAYRDRATVVETNGVYEGRAFVGYADEAFNQLYRVANNEWNSPIFSALELSATKRTATIEGIASYVRQWRHMDGTWQPHDPGSFIQPDAFANDRGIGSPMGFTSTTEANSLSGSHMAQRTTGSAQWQDHVVRGGVTWRAPWSVLFSTNYVFQSGAWSGPIISRVAAADPAFGPPTVTLSNGRRVTNPLATTFRFAYETRGDQQVRTPALHVWNIRVGRAFSLGRVKVDAGLDVFNVTNNGADASFQPNGHQIFSTEYGETTFRQLPRSAQFILRSTF